MRLPSIAATALAAATIAAVPVPAMAQASDPDISGVTEALGDPQLQDQAAGMIGAMMEAVLDLPAAPLLDAAARMRGEEDAGLPADTRLGDLAGADGADAAAIIQQQVPQMMDVMAGMTEAFAAMLPAFRGMAEQAGRDLEERLPPPPR